jgi:hypothetical protein
MWGDWRNILSPHYFFKMKIKYSKKIDREVFNEVNEMCPRLAPIMGFKFKKITFNNKAVPIAKKIARSAKHSINEKKLREIMKSIFRKELPDITMYINTTPFSTWNVKDKWVSVSYTMAAQGRFFYTICHEANHFMYDYVFNTEKYQDTEIKETITVINNAFGIQDKGWPNFQEQRKRAIEVYDKTRSIEAVIDDLKKKRAEV